MITETIKISKYYFKAFTYQKAWNGSDFSFFMKLLPFWGIIILAYSKPSWKNEEVQVLVHENSEKKEMPLFHFTEESLPAKFFSAF